MKNYYVYIMSSATRTIYTGMTNDLRRRIHEHKHKKVPGFTSRYNVTRLVYYEEYPSAIQAIKREKQIKSWSRAKKKALIESVNPRWVDLSLDWGEDQ